MKHKKQQIIAQGIDLFRTSGYHATGLQEILDTCGIPKGTFYNYFSNKEEYALAVLDNYSKSMLAIFETHLERSSRSAGERLQRLYLDLASRSEKDGGKKGCLLMNFANELGGTHDDIARRAEVHLVAWFDRLAECVALGQQKGEFRIDYSSFDLAEFVHTSIMGSNGISKIQRDGVAIQKMMNMSLKFLELPIGEVVEEQRHEPTY
jgi:TetR/AcrR family transcriptional repressor of nem operon